MKLIKQIKERMKAIPFFMGCYNVYYNLRFGRRINKKKKYFLLENTELLQKFTSTLNNKGILFWLEFGTLLGYYREHDFIKHDCDLDIGAHIDDAEKIQKALTENGFELVREFHAQDGGLEECYRYLHTTIDVFYFSTEGNDPSTRFCEAVKCSVFPIKKKHLNKKLKGTVRRRYVPDNEFEKVVFKGCNIYIPKKIKEILISYYGNDFMIPDPNFNPADHSDNVVFYSYEENPGTCLFKELPL